MSLNYNIYPSFCILWFCHGILLLVWERKLKNCLPAFVFFWPMYQYLYVLDKSHLNSIAPAFAPVFTNSIVITRQVTFPPSLRRDFFSDPYLIWKRIASFSHHWEFRVYFLAMDVQPNFAETTEHVCRKIQSFENCAGLTVF